ncbi:MAG: nucleotide exchange factor GrpE, partial [bacterium]
KKNKDDNKENPDAEIISADNQKETKEKDTGNDNNNTEDREKNINMSNEKSPGSEKTEDGLESSEKKNEDPLAALNERIEELECENKELNQKLLYRMAEFDNYRRRTAQENIQLIQSANKELIKQILPVMDSLKRAVAEDNKKFSAEALFEGIQLINNQVMDIMDKNGIKAMEPVGKPFDPLLHDALMQAPSSDFDENIIMQEVETGYMLYDNVIRPAKVIVSKGSETEEEETGEATNGQNDKKISIEKNNTEENK